LTCSVRQTPEPTYCLPLGSRRGSSSYSTTTSAANARLYHPPPMYGWSYAFLESSFRASTATWRAASFWRFPPPIIRLTSRSSYFTIPHTSESGYSSIYCSTRIHRCGRPIAERCRRLFALLNGRRRAGGSHAFFRAAVAVLRWSRTVRLVLLAVVTLRPPLAAGSHPIIGSSFICCLRFFHAPGLRPVRTPGEGAGTLA